ncbi:6794_t:CDS:2, partial [Diversispora eburnea]
MSNDQLTIDTLRELNSKLICETGAVENAELKARVAKLEQKQLQTDEKNNFIASQNNTSNSDVAPERIENSSNNTPDDNNNKISEIFDIQIPEFLLEVIITGSSKITAQNITNLFIIAMKVRQKEILCWYCYYKVYECINKIDDQSARTLVYNEIKTLLPDITD